MTGIVQSYLDFIL